MCVYYCILYCDLFVERMKQSKETIIKVLLLSKTVCYLISYFLWIRVKVISALGIVSVTEIGGS